MIEEVDVAILGAGPAGLVAALRLLQLGYRVAIVDKRSFPRPHVGESLTPGVADILDFLGVPNLLGRVASHWSLRLRRVWENREEQLTADISTSHRIVDRGLFDLELLNRARERGALTFVPAHYRLEENADFVTIEARTQESGNPHGLHARFLLDARGRARGTPTAPPLFAFWIDLATGDYAEEMRVEALPQAWLWGCPISNGRFRVMAFCDPTPSGIGGLSPRKWLQGLLPQSRLFADFAQGLASMPLRGRLATPYVSSNCWQRRSAKIGEAAFAIDPLSSSGVEKAMRFALQAVTAVHTALSDPVDSSLAQDFYECQMREALERHAAWASALYARAWPNAGHYSGSLGDVPFFQARALPARAPSPQSMALPTGAIPEPLTTISDSNTNSAIPLLPSIARARVKLSATTRFQTLPCAVGNRVERRVGVITPTLDRPVAFVEGFELQPLLASMTAAADLGQWLDLCAMRMPQLKAARIAGWLLKHQVIVC